MYKISTSRFHSYQGLHEILPDGKSLNAFVAHLATLISEDKLEFEDNVRNHKKEIKIIDTFFSDTIEPENLNILFFNALDKGYTIQILVLNPYSNVAVERVKSLRGLTATQEINKGLHEIKKAIFSDYARTEDSTSLEEEWKSGRFIAEQVNDIGEHEYTGRVEIRFYSILAEAPVYIVGDLLMKGLLTHSATAAKNPWLVFVNDTSYNDDTYDYLYRNFDAIWADMQGNTDSINLLEGKDIYGNKLE